jgi:hypothetical protein
VSLKGGDVEPRHRLSLLRRLSDLDAGWLVWKNGDSAVNGTGDIDSAAPLEARRGIVGAFRAWAAGAGLGPTIVCEHAPRLLILVACIESRPSRLFQLDVYDSVAGVAPASALTIAADADPDGYRRLRPGAEGLLRLVAAVERPGRRPRSTTELERIRELLRGDLDGAEMLAAALGRVGARALSGARAVASGSWDYRAMLLLELALLERAACDPRPRAAWLRFRLGRGSRCPVLAALAAGRVMPGDREAWLADVARQHELS